LELTDPEWDCTPSGRWLAVPEGEGFSGRQHGKALVFGRLMVSVFSPAHSGWEQRSELPAYGDSILFYFNRLQSKWEKNLSGLLQEEN